MNINGYSRHYDVHMFHRAVKQRRLAPRKRQSGHECQLTIYVCSRQFITRSRFVSFPPLEAATSSYGVHICRAESGVIEDN